VAAAIASLVAANLERAGLSGGTELRALVFLTIAVTVTLAGLTAGTVGNFLGVRLRSRDTVAILGAHTLGLALGKELRRGGVPVVFLDSNPNGIRRAEEAGFPAVYGDALQESVMQRARFGFARTVVALTPNRTLNSVFVERARDRFGVPRGLVATSEAGVGLVSEQVGSGKANIVFDGPHDVERWEVRGRRGDVEIEYFTFAPPEVVEGQAPAKAGGLSERFAMISTIRAGATSAMNASFKHREGDVCAVAIHVPEREEALRDLANRGWSLTELDVSESEDETQVASTDNPDAVGPGNAQQSPA
jgi:Trk K+ transport system NAD-binding subunit